jgi:PAS domain S-box-containing protein
MEWGDGRGEVAAVQRTSWLLAFAVATGACIGVWALTAWSDRQTVLEAAEASLAATARLLEQHADRALEAGDRMVLAAVEATGDPAGLADPARLATLHQRLRAIVQDSPQVASLWVMDAAGRNVVETWGHPPAPGPGFSTRPYFRTHRDGEGGLHIGQQAVGSVTRRPRFTLSRPLRSAEGAFAGLVAAGVYTDYFGATYAEAGLGAGARFALFRADGAPLAAWPPTEAAGPTAVTAGGVPPPGLGAVSATEDSRLTAVRHLARFPVVLVVSQPMVDVLADWRRRMWRNGAATAAAVCTLAALTLLGLRGARQQRALMRALRRERGELEQRVAERTVALAESEARFREMADNAPVMVYVTDAGGCCTFLSRSWQDFTGQGLDRALGHGWLDAIHPEDRSRADAAFALSQTRQAPYRLEYRLRRADGAWRWALDAAAPRRDPAGGFLGYVGSVIDITERREAEERQALMARELDHRAKNALTVVQAALRLTPREDAAAYAEAVEGRVAALARAHAALAQGRWQGVALRRLVEAELSIFMPPAPGTPRAVLDGPALMLCPPAVQALSMALHELATNAVKYGALSVPAGRLAVTWEVDHAARRLCIRWTERGGPAPARALTRRGFGSRVIEATVQGQLGGVLDRRWEAAGLSCELRLPLARVLAPEAGTKQQDGAAEELELAEG